MSLSVITSEMNQKIAGTSIGETILVHLTTGKVEKVVLSEISKLGVEGFDVDLKSQPLTFYPYNNILKIKKFTE